MRYLDTNVIVDALVDQGTATRPASVRLLGRLMDGQETLATTELVISETVFILRSPRAGRLSSEAIASRLKPLVRSRFLGLPNRELWERVLDIMATYNVDLPDAHLIATMETTGDTEAYSFDSDYDRIPGMTRIEP